MTMAMAMATCSCSSTTPAPPRRGASGSCSYEGVPFVALAGPLDLCGKQIILRYCWLKKKSAQGFSRELQRAPASVTKCQCGKVASFGAPGSKKRTHCGTCKAADMVNCRVRAN